MALEYVERKELYQGGWQHSGPGILLLQTQWPQSHWLRNAHVSREAWVHDEAGAGVGHETQMWLL